MSDAAFRATYDDFLKGLINSPRRVSAPAPSSPVLARAIASAVDPGRDGLVVELGAGTGAVTAALLARGIAAERILAIEEDAGFVALLRRQFPAIRVQHGDALFFEQHLPAGTAVAGIVSGLPLLHLPKPARRALLNRALECQTADGRLIQLSYSWRSPIPLWSDIAVETRLVWRNFPPAHVWVYRRR